MPKLPKEPSRSEVTPESLYMRRREFIKNAALFAGTAAAVGGGLTWLTRGGAPQSSRAEPPPEPPHGGATPSNAGTALKIAKRGKYIVNEKQNSYEEITTYNN